LGDIERWTSGSSRSRHHRRSILEQTALANEMKAILIDRYGPSNVMRLGLTERPQPARDQILIETHYASVNPADWKIRAGLLSRVAGEPFPMTLGMDGAGIVAGVGADVTDFKIGDRVAALSGVGLGIGAKGTYAQYFSTPAVRAVVVPDHISLEEAATVPIAAASACRSIIDVAKAKSGDVVLVNGGSGSVGTFAVQFLKQLGAKVAATCSSASVSRLEALGVDHVIDYSRTAVLSAAREWAGGGYDSIIDAVGQASLPRNTPDIIKSGGTLVCIQNLLTDVEAFDLAAAAGRNVRVVDNVMSVHNVGTPLFQVEGFRRIAAYVFSREIKVPPYKIVQMEDAASAHDEVEAGHFRQKILLEIPR